MKLKNLEIDNDLLKSKLHQIASNFTDMNISLSYSISDSIWSHFPYKTRKFAYAFYASDLNYLCGVIVNIEKIKAFGHLPHVDFVLIHRNIERNILDHLKELYHLVLVEGGDYGYYVNDGYYRDCLMKLQIYEMTDYERIIFFDSDSILLKSIEHLFFLPDVPLAAPWAYWNMDAPQFTSLLLVAKPSKVNFERVKKWFTQAKEKNLYDMDILNWEFSVLFPDPNDQRYCRQYSEIIMLPSFYGLLIGEWGPDWNNRLKWHVSEQKLFEELGYLVHFSGVKPWNHVPEKARYPYLSKVYNLWKDIANEKCKFI